MFLWGLWIDPLYLVLFFATLIISGAAQFYIKSQFSKWSAVRNSAGLAGERIGERLVAGVDFGGARGTATGISFKTVRGEVGIMEILDIVEDDRGHSGDGKGHGMKFRYRMVRR